MEIFNLTNQTIRRLSRQVRRERRGFYFYLHSHPTGFLNRCFRQGPERSRKAEREENMEKTLILNFLKKDNTVWETRLQDSRFK